MLLRLLSEVEMPNSIIQNLPIAMQSKQFPLRPVLRRRSWRLTKQANSCNLPLAIDPTSWWDPEDRQCPHRCTGRCSSRTTRWDTSNC